MGKHEKRGDVLNNKLLSRWNANKFEEFLASSSSKEKLLLIASSLQGASTSELRITRPMSGNVNNDNEE